MMQAEEQPALAPTLKPLGDMIVLLPARTERKAMALGNGLVMDLRESAGGVALPDSADNSEMEGTVVALGDGRREPIALFLAQRLAAVAYDHMSEYADDIDLANMANALIAESAKPLPFEVKVGDVVTFVPWMATSIKPPGSEDEFFLVSEANIIGIVVSG